MQVIQIPKRNPNSPDEPDMSIELTHIGRDPWGRHQWAYMVVSNGQVVMDRADLTAPRCQPPVRMARTLMSFLEAAGESLALFGDESSYITEYLPRERTFLAANHERFTHARYSI